MLKVDILGVNNLGMNISALPPKSPESSRTTSTQQGQVSSVNLM